MTTHEKALEKACMALIDVDPTMSGYHQTHIDVKRKYAEAAITAYLSALLPEDAADLVAKMTSEYFRHEMQHLRSSSEIDRLFQQAASLIQSQAARIAELERERDGWFQATKNVLETGSIVPMPEQRHD